jgi:hypothetical protein
VAASVLAILIGAVPHTGSLPPHALRATTLDSCLSWLRRPLPGALRAHPPCSGCRIRRVHDRRVAGVRRQRRGVHGQPGAAVPGGTARVKVTHGNSLAVMALLVGVGGGSFGCAESRVTSSGTCVVMLTRYSMLRHLLDGCRRVGDQPGLSRACTGSSSRSLQFARSSARITGRLGQTLGGSTAEHLTRL